MNKEELRKHLETFLLYKKGVFYGDSIEQYLSTIPDEPKERYFVVFFESSDGSKYGISLRGVGMFNRKCLVEEMRETYKKTDIDLTNFKELTKQDYENFIK